MQAFPWLSMSELKKSPISKSPDNSKRSFKLKVVSSSQRIHEQTDIGMPTATISMKNAKGALILIPTEINTGMATKESSNMKEMVQMNMKKNTVISNMVGLVYLIGTMVVTHIMDGSSTTMRTIMENITVTGIMTICLPMKLCSNGLVSLITTKTARLTQMS